MKDYTVLYYGTLGMVILSGAIILFVLWAASIINKIKSENAARDSIYLQRFNKIEESIGEKFYKLIEAFIT